MKTVSCPRCGTNFQTETSGSTICPMCDKTILTVRDSSTSNKINQHDLDPPEVRPFGRTLIYGIITLGLYWIYYEYRAFKEMDDSLGKAHHTRVFVAYTMTIVFSSGFSILLPNQPAPIFDILDSLLTAIPAIFLTWYVYHELKQWELDISKHAKLLAVGLASPLVLLFAISLIAYPMATASEAESLPGWLTATLVGIVVLAAGVLVVQIITWKRIVDGINDYWRDLS